MKKLSELLYIASLFNSSPYNYYANEIKIKPKKLFPKYCDCGARLKLNKDNKVKCLRCEKEWL